MVARNMNESVDVAVLLIIICKGDSALQDFCKNSVGLSTTFSTVDNDWGSRLQLAAAVAWDAWTTSVTIQKSSHYIVSQLLNRTLLNNWAQISIDKLDLLLPFLLQFVMNVKRNNKREGNRWRTKQYETVMIARKSQRLWTGSVIEVEIWKIGWVV